MMGSSDKLTNTIPIEETKKLEIEREEGEMCYAYNKSSILTNAKTIILEVLESRGIKPGTIFYINAGGLVNSHRKTQDGKVYFGTYSGCDPAQINDCVVSTEEKGFGKRHFMIEYDLGKKE